VRYSTWSYAMRHRPFDPMTSSPDYVWWLT
jgi:hypothetical protein